MPVPNLTSEEITVMLQNLNAETNHGVLDALLPLVYDELHRQAHRYLRGERRDHTLQTTALINEVYLRLIGQNAVEWQNRAHFFALAANMMRRILVDYAKTKHRVKRGGSSEDLPLDDALSVAAEMTDEAVKIDLIALDDALDKLAKKDERLARIVELRYFSGLTVEETAEVMKISTMTVKRDWNTAKAWLFKEIKKN
ncbi:MAG TPA: sigma-70 family RNA polymerase sigma factor [Pyrinomonadaceae bacterium]|nr:sigma-70 family RNA polymerase sigma factor [Pyrinomonadaceae bacterium]